MAIVHLFIHSVPRFHEYIKLAKGLWSSGIFLEKVGYTYVFGGPARFPHTEGRASQSLYLHVYGHARVCVRVV
jgi:hypothetical protein